ncbi:Bis(5'-nucleosyl)-tetraphosphatase PrpE [asymmetrical] [Seminavis robusta]|uniref:Bis(5'-nucleosyl)-tetraphosphatase PrpE [asymmetrical] n=1 Tax=Seminavis robusta TaxID=568900 RepID=A0A9N8DXN3_9STRA|nr:Bis(5'-nucleosyl)-tetraphosphatase PrpE [asymmetrical] [Seminavis robusta]|eukprot:Sro445_g144560.1 Bis(5'-nucleosyl)-tetraphosphatase PrpE [asymmetrical] (373) ;mRNA; r:46607-47725
MRQKALKHALLLASAGITGSAAYASLTGVSGRDQSREPDQKSLNGHGTTRSFSRHVVATSSHHGKETCTSPSSTAKRTYETEADHYFQRRGKIPLPKTMHANLVDLMEETSDDDDAASDKILVIGDVHGCYEELMLLHEKAKTEHNDNRPFRCVILVGDLCNKGPFSAKVIQHVRKTPRWFSIRGNHDDAALAAALGDETRRQKKTYQWVMAATEAESLEVLSDEDVLWMSELPYTIHIPSTVLSDAREEDVLIVHAGLIPKVPLEEQSIKTMVTLREVCQEASTGEYTDFDEKSQESERLDPEPWASAWKGPWQIIFGHDARRGLQQYAWATGLDTGAVYGKQLTGLVLPDKALVHVKSIKAHSPITYKQS